MKHTEAEITQIATKVLKDIDGPYYREKCIEKVWFEKEEVLLKGTDEGQKHPCWTIAVNAIFNNTDYLIISDESGEPLFYSNFNYITTEVIKKQDGSYGL